MIATQAVPTLPQLLTVFPRGTAPGIHSNPSHILPSKVADDITPLPGCAGEAYRTWGSNVFRFLHYRGVARDLLEDGTQEVFYRAHRKWHSIREDARRKEWLFGIAGLVAKELVRKQRQSALRNPLMDFTGDNEPRDPNSNPSSDQGLEHNQLAQVLDPLLARLPEDQRLVLVLRRIEGFTARETGEILRLLPRAVNSRLEAAEKRLRDWLAHDPRSTP